MSVLPVNCVSCGGIFDLSFDLAGQEDMNFRFERLCWGCRKRVFEGLTELKEVMKIQIDF